MKINLNEFELDDFILKEGVFCGIDAILITPNAFRPKFDQRNKIFRSSIWTPDGNLLSAGLKKFVNWGENPENFPVPSSLDKCNVVSKIDGSSCILDNINGEISMRTRGTFSYKTMENYEDFEECLFNCENIRNFLFKNPNVSLIFELTTPNLKIVIDYDSKPKFWLIGCIDKTDYSLKTQHELNLLSKELGVDRPDTFEFKSTDDLLKFVEDWKDNEGVCVYSKNDQEIHKVKSAWYLALHRFKSNANLETVLDMFLELGCPYYYEFQEKLIENFDYECWSMIQGYASNVVDAYKTVNEIIEHMDIFAYELRNVPRAEAAKKIIEAYGNTNRSGFVFNFLDGKPLENKSIKKLMYQVLKK